MGSSGPLASPQVTNLNTGQLVAAAKLSFCVSFMGFPKGPWVQESTYIAVAYATALARPFFP